MTMVELGGARTVSFLEMGLRIDHTLKSDNASHRPSVKIKKYSFTLYFYLHSTELRLTWTQVGNHF